MTINSENIIIIVIALFILIYLPMILFLRFYYLKPWSYLKNQLFFGLKVKYAVWIVPIPFGLFVPSIILNF